MTLNMNNSFSKLLINIMFKAFKRKIAKIHSRATNRVIIQLEK